MTREDFYRAKIEKLKEMGLIAKNETLESISKALIANLKRKTK